MSKPPGVKPLVALFGVIGGFLFLLYAWVAVVLAAPAPVIVPVGPGAGGVGCATLYIKLTNGNSTAPSPGAVPSGVPTAYVDLPAQQDCNSPQQSQTVSFQNGNNTIQPPAGACAGVVISPPISNTIGLQIGGSAGVPIAPNQTAVIPLPSPGTASFVLYANDVVPSVREYFY